MRIETELTEEDSDHVKTLANERGLRKDRAYTELIRTGINVEQRRELVKDRIVQFFEDQKPRHDKRMAVLRDQYDIDEVNSLDEGWFEVIHNGCTYAFRTPHDLGFVNGESVDKSICPACGSNELDLDLDVPEPADVEYICEDCGHEFDKADKKGVPDEETAEHVTEFVRRRHDLFKYVVGQLTELLNGIMGTYGADSRYEWLYPGRYQYRNGFQTVTIPFWLTDKSQIQFNVAQYLGSYEALTNPLYRAARQRLTADYLKLVQEVRAVNQDANRVQPIFIDPRGQRPEIIEVCGLDDEETSLPLYTVGYEVEKVEPPAEELESEHDADATVTWIQVVGEKPIEQEVGDEQ